MASLRGATRKMVIFALDGVDPDILSRLIKQGMLPNFQKLRESGVFGRLAPPIPSVSPVIWTSFGTGTNPAKHGILDLFTKKPNSYNLELCMHSSFPDGDGILTYQKTRHGKTFWELLGEKGVKSAILHLPGTFPPDRFNGIMISGMGTTDLRGTFGVTSLYTTNREMTSSHGLEVKFVSSPKGGKKWYESDIEGPKGIRQPLYFRAMNDKLIVSLDEEHSKQLALGRGQWSNWIDVKFPVSPGRTIQGITQFKLLELKGDRIDLLRIPVQPSPQSPVTPYTYPPQLSAEITEKIGHYKILDRTEDGMDPETFMEDLNERLESKIQVTKYCMKQMDWDILLTYVHTIDNVQHIMWKYYDPRSPQYDARGADIYGDLIHQSYQKIDQKIGEILSMLDRNATIVVLSDHGTNCILRTFHPNTWLYEQGLLHTLGKGKVETPLGGTFHPKSTDSRPIDWEKTKAFWYGRGLFLNVKGREPLGTVQRGRDYYETRDSIINQLRDARNPEDGRKIFKKIFLQEEIWSGPFLRRMPDIVPVFEKGYALGWADIYGEVDPKRDAVETFRGTWTANHTGPYLPEDIAGILLVKGPGIRKDEKIRGARMVDLAPTILHIFGQEIPPMMDGRILHSLFEK